ncbi:MAG TPA: hypothetical protein DEZ27_01455 [Sphaerochaeta sp.]|jgi:transcriptional regulator with XRE-family HTH domain|nr:hypothetical protein [Sphaerochaeta sp.]
MSKEVAFWNRVEHQMAELSIKYLDLWKAIGVSSNTGAGWRAKKRLPPADSCLAIARHLDVSVEYLITGSETALLDDSYTYEMPDLDYQERVERDRKRVPRSLPDDLLGALSYCGEVQMKYIRRILKLPSGE